MPSKKNAASTDIRLVRVQIAAEPVDSGRLSDITRDTEVLSGKFGVPVNTPSPIGVGLQLLQPDGVAIIILPNRLDLFIEIPLDSQSSPEKALVYVVKRTKKPFTLMKKHSVEVMRWCGLVATFQVPDSSAKDGFEAAQNWVTTRSLPFVQSAKLSQFGYSIGYQHNGVNQILSVQGFGTTPGTLFSGIEYALDLNDKALGKSEKIESKVAKLMVQVKSASLKLAKSGFEKWQ
jgi:hypothetical protein